MQQALEAIEKIRAYLPDFGQKKGRPKSTLQKFLGEDA